jgi:putative flippase GtrA
MNNKISNLFKTPNFVELIKFAFVGALGTIVNLSILYTLTELFNVYYIISETIAFLVSVLHNYILNKIWTFKENLHERIFTKYFKYIMINLISLCINLTILFFLVEFYGFWYIFAEVVAISCAFLNNFIVNKFWTFKSEEL